MAMPPLVATISLGFSAVAVDETLAVAYHATHAEYPNAHPQSLTLWKSVFQPHGIPRVFPDFRDEDRQSAPRLRIVERNGEHRTSRHHG
jgi:hypothetical protein